mmetsp:Transcript_110860/g.313725  ORF Transcript_110860/g.313725 Transcript_110860/m.313725 type:complete len:241 (+) Transcript_110860:750-1472(+)
MQTEAHLHPEVPQALQQAWVAAVHREDPGLAHLGDDPDEGHHRHVSELGLLLRGGPGEAPDEEKGIADIFVGRTVVVVNATVHNLANLVHEEHYLLFKDFRGVHKVANVAKANDGIHRLAGHHGVHASCGAALHVLPDDLGSGFAKAQRKEASQLYDRLFQHDRLHRFLGFSHVPVLVDHLPAVALLGEVLHVLGVLDLLTAVLQVTQSHCFQWIVLDGLHLCNHAFDGIQKEFICVLGK